MTAARQSVQVQTFGSGDLSRFMVNRGCCQQAIGTLNEGDIHWFNGEVQRRVTKEKVAEDTARQKVGNILRQRLERRAGLN